MHVEIVQMIDRSLAGGSSAEEERVLLEHLQGCAACRSYRDASVRAIAALKGYSFPVDAGLNRKVFASLAQRAEELDMEGGRWVQVWVGSMVAVALTIAGSFGASHVGRLLAALFPVEAAQLHFGVIAFWIAPSLCFCLLFPLLAAWRTGGMNEKGSSL